MADGLGSGLDYNLGIDDQIFPYLPMHRLIHLELFALQVVHQQ
jgi:hypothetical protein